MARRNAVRLTRWTLLAVVLALGWTAAMATPAAADAPDVTVTFDGDECGIVRVTVTNDEDVEFGYALALDNEDATTFTIPARDTREHRIRVHGGAVITFVPGIVVGPFTYRAPVGCQTAALEMTGEMGCVNGLITVVNNGGAPAAEVRILVGDEEVVAPTSIAPGRTLTVVVAPAGVVDLEVEQRADDPSGAFFIVDGFQDGPIPVACRGHAVQVEDTCTGVSIEVESPTGPSLVEKLVVDTVPAGPQPREFDVPRPGGSVDVPVPAGTLLAIGFRFRQTLSTLDRSFVVAEFHRHVRPTPCPPPTSASPTAKAGGGGGLPVTGAPTMAAAGLGAGLLALGCLALVVVRRRRTSPEKG